MDEEALHPPGNDSRPIAVVVSPVTVDEEEDEEETKYMPSTPENFQPQKVSSVHAFTSTPENRLLLMSCAFSSSSSSSLSSYGEAPSDPYCLAEAVYGLGCRV